MAVSREEKKNQQAELEAALLTLPRANAHYVPPEAAATAVADSTLLQLIRTRDKVHTQENF